MNIYMLCIRDRLVSGAVFEEGGEAGDMIALVERAPEESVVGVTLVDVYLGLRQAARDAKLGEGHG